MGTIVFNVDTTVAFYFEEKNRLQLNQLIQQNHNSVREAANNYLPKPVNVQLVVDIVTNADEIQNPQVTNLYSGNPLLEFAFTGFKPAYENVRYSIPIHLKKIETDFLSTDVIFRDTRVPVEDVNSNNITVVPPSETEVISLANDE